MDDRDIISLYWDRNEEAIYRTAEKYGNYCFSTSYNILANAEDANECVNDTYLSAWNSIPPQRPKLLQAYLAKITRNRSLNKYRSVNAQKRGGGIEYSAYEELSGLIPHGKDIDSEIEDMQIGQIIERFLNRLSEEKRRVFVLRYWYFDSVLSISEQTGLSESKVKNMLFRIRKKLKDELLKEGVYIER